MGRKAVLYGPPTIEAHDSNSTGDSHIMADMSGLVPVLTAAQFWDAAADLYGGIAAPLIALQDRFGVVVNVALLFGWLDRRHLALIPDDHTRLLSTAKDHETALRQMRVHRRAAKGRPGYDDLKVRELQAEARMQQALLESVEMPLVTAATANSLTAYLDGLDIPADTPDRLQVQAAFSPSGPASD